MRLEGAEIDRLKIERDSESGNWQRLTEIERVEVVSD